MPDEHHDIEMFNLKGVHVSLTTDFKCLQYNGNTYVCMEKLFNNYFQKINNELKRLDGKTVENLQSTISVLKQYIEKLEKHSEHQSYLFLKKIDKLNKTIEQQKNVINNIQGYKNWKKNGNRYTYHLDDLHVMVCTVHFKRRMMVGFIKNIKDKSITPIALTISTRKNTIDECLDGFEAFINGENSDQTNDK
jgi:hypothetical protein